MNSYILKLSNEFETCSNLEIAEGQKAYMKHHFDFFGLKSPLRRELQQPFLAKENLPVKEDLEAVVKLLWQKPEREFQYFAQELLFKYKKQFTQKDIELFEYMITHKSWWDSVDFIATNLVGFYFLEFPHQVKSHIEKWLDSDDIWLKRTALLFQLKYKHQLDEELLVYVVKSLLGSREFFINKAIGWILREYSKTNPDWVKAFVNNHPLDKLSRREALKRIESV